jgi:hypothetical protein
MRGMDVQNALPTLEKPITNVPVSFSLNNGCLMFGLFVQ